jgi:hypothetical protein
VPALLGSTRQLLHRSGPPGDHLARYQHAEREGLISRAGLAAVVATLEVIAPHVIVRADLAGSERAA